MLTNNRILSLIVVLLLAVTAIVWVVLIFSWPALSQPVATQSQATTAPFVTTTPSSPAAPTSTPAPSPTPTPLPNGVVAVVNGITITLQEWQVSTNLDRTMNALADFPQPNPEETLSRMVDEVLLLQNNPTTATIAMTQVESRLDELQRGWGISDDLTMQALANANLSRDDLLTRLTRLIQIEAVLQTLATQGVDSREWLTVRRQQATVSLFQPLNPLTETIALAASPENPPTVTPTTQAVIDATVTPTVVAPPADLPIGVHDGQVAPDFSLSNLDGQLVSLRSLRGKPTVLNFWASWCPACRSEIPALENSYQRLQSQVNFVAVDLEEREETLRPFVAEQGMSFPVLLDLRGEVGGSLYQVSGIPTTLFLDPRGVVIRRHVGPVDEATIQTVLAPYLSE